MLGNGTSTTTRTQFEKALGARLADFMHDPLGAVTTINSRCSSATKGLIPTIVDTSMITTFTRVVAGNAVYMKGSWVTDFVRS